MVHTLIPYGSINEDLIESILFQPSNNRHYLIDNIGNRWVIDETTYLNLQAKGVKDYAFRKSQD